MSTEFLKILFISVSLVSSFTECRKKDKMFVTLPIFLLLFPVSLEVGSLNEFSMGMNNLLILNATISLNFTSRDKEKGEK